MKKCPSCDYVDKFKNFLIVDTGPLKVNKPSDLWGYEPTDNSLKACPKCGTVILSSDKVEGSFEFFSDEDLTT